MDFLFIFCISTVAVLLAYTAYKYITRNNRYFDTKPIPSLAPEPIFGSMRHLVLKKVSSTEFIRSIYERFPHDKVFGMFDFGTPVFVVRDPELIKRIAIKDFDHFVNHRPMFGRNTDPNSEALFAKTLFALTDHQWRQMRATLSPAFTGNKMRQMFDLIVGCSVQMVRFYRSQANGAAGGLLPVLELKDVFGRFANDVIATCAFGLEVDSFRVPDNAFFANGKQLINFNRASIMLKVIGYSVFPRLLEKLQVDLFDRDQTKFFAQIIRDTVRLRETEGVVRMDMINLLLKAQKGTLKHTSTEKDEPTLDGFATVEESDVGKLELHRSPFSEMEFIAQCLIFFLAGFDAVSVTLTFLVYELTLNRNVQDKLYVEVLATEKTLTGKPLSYDSLQQMKYMDMVVSEALRKWTTAPFADRVCTRDYVLETDDYQCTIDKGTVVFIPIAAIHHDPLHYPDPERFDPERFNERNRESIRPGTYLPFGIGPRNCIGSRFALMEVKAIVYHLLQCFAFERAPETQVPPPLVKGFAGLGPEKGVYVQFKLRDNKQASD
ncbi:probable cytochrome P450 9f2 [Anopheles darlingi]|uniref:probable cytochrome P450 9f2 n=1 Tax=Anopheles darlingi TaxID=43151 RepID=UPI002100542E|nr:probable cytochrome P450 9f2 [Anopheles darlingi]